MNTPPSHSTATFASGQAKSKRQSQRPALKKRYFSSSGAACPFCGSKDITSGYPEVEGMIARAEVGCPHCGHNWQDVWSLIDIVAVRDKEGNEVKDSGLGNSEKIYTE